jgi:hypothetical protein
MSGLIPNRKTKEQLESANRGLVNRHKDYVDAWIKERRSEPEKGEDSTVQKGDLTCLRVC